MFQKAVKMAVFLISNKHVDILHESVLHESVMPVFTVVYNTDTNVQHRQNTYTVYL